MLTNCFSFAPRDSVPGIIAKICKYLKAHPGWSIEELKEVIGDIETSLAIGEVSYFTNQSINDLNILELYDVGYRFVFIGGEDVYGVMYALEKSGDNVVANGVSLGVTASEFNQLKSVVTNLSNAAYTAQNPPPYPVTKVNGRTGEVSLDLPDVLSASTAQTMLMNRVNFDSTELATWNAFYDNGYRLVGVLSDDGSTVTAAYILGQNTNNHAPIPMAVSSGGNVTSVNGDIGEVFTLRVDPNDPGIPTNPPVPINATTLNGKSAEYYTNPRNLLDNSDFRNPINQRGQTTYETAGYTIDRWYATTAETEVTVNEGYLSITNNHSSARQAYRQLLPDKHTGKTLTLAICLNNGSIYSNSGVIPEADGSLHYFASADFQDGSYNCTTRICQQNTGALEIQISVAVGYTLNVKWIALYEGEYTADNLPPYVPKGYAAELAACRMYYQGERYSLATASVDQGGKQWFVETLVDGEMRASPTVTIKEIRYVGTNGQEKIFDTLPAITVTKYRHNARSVVTSIVFETIPIAVNNLTSGYVLFRYELSADL